MTAADDRVEPDAVTRVLASHVDPALRCESVVRAAVGNGQETWLVEASGGSAGPRGFVLRRSASAGVLDDTDRAHEYATLQALQGHGLPTPRAYGLETAPSCLGRPFFVMDRLPGRPASPASTDEAAGIARDLGRRLAQLHTAAVGVPDDTDVRTATSREIVRWRERYLARRVTPVPMVGALLAWLEAHLPAAGVPPRLLWGDPGPHNVLVEDDRISGLLDWELSHCGHPLEDLGAAVWACLGRYPEDEVVAGYEQVCGSPVDRELLAYFAVLACVSRTVMQLVGIAAFVGQQSRALNLAGLGLTLPTANLRRAAGYAGWPVVDPAPAGSGPDVLAAALHDPDDPDDPDDLRLRPDVGETLAGVARFLAEDVLPEAGTEHLRRGLKTAVGLLHASAQRHREERAGHATVQAGIDELFERLETVGVVPAGGRRDAAALEAAAARAEREPRFAGVRDDVRRMMLRDLVQRTSAVSRLSELYGRDVATGPAFRR